MQTTGQIDELRSLIREARQQGRRIGCVPTMGALHAGHLSLVTECSKHVDDVIVTIFVNPTQFGPQEDLNKYPRPLLEDLAKCQSAGVHCVYTPTVSDLYPAGYDTWVTTDAMSTILEGACRPGHFRGVTTIVAKLFNIVQPDVACFGAKDFQQQSIIRRMVRDLNFPIEILIGETIREPDGLAMSSRNIYLSEAERNSALSLSQALQLAETQLQQGHTIAEAEAAMLEHLKSFPLVRPEYAVIRDPQTLEPIDAFTGECVALIAAFVGQTRLIDNRMITARNT